MKNNIGKTKIISSTKKIHEMRLDRKRMEQVDHLKLKKL